MKYPVGSQVQFIADGAMKHGTVTSIHDTHRAIEVRGEEGYLKHAENLMPYHAPQNDYYAYRNAVDEACAMIKKAEGRPLLEVAANTANTAMIDICTRRNETLQAKEKAS